MDYRQPDLSVITVNYNGFHDTCEFIDSWAATVFSVSYEMIVIEMVPLPMKPPCYKKHILLSKPYAVSGT